MTRTAVVKRGWGESGTGTSTTTTRDSKTETATGKCFSLSMPVEEKLNAARWSQSWIVQCTGKNCTRI